MNLSKEAANAQKEYMKQWRANNKDKVKNNNRNYWERLAKKNAAEEVQAK